MNLYGCQLVSFEVGEQLSNQRYVDVEGGSLDGFITVSLPSSKVFIHDSHLMFRPQFPLFISRSRPVHHLCL